MANLETSMSMEANNPLGGCFPMYFTFRLLICICIFSLSYYPLVKVIHLSSYKFKLARFTLILIWEWKRKFRPNESVSTIWKFVPWDLCYFCHKSLDVTLGQLLFFILYFFCIVEKWSDGTRSPPDDSDAVYTGASQISESRPSWMCQGFLYQVPLVLGWSTQNAWF